MSLKITHTVIIIFSIILMGFFTYFMATNASESYSQFFLIIGSLSTLGLVYYLISIIKKFKTI